MSSLVLLKKNLEELKFFFIYHILQLFEKVEWFFLLIFTSYFLSQSKLPFAEAFGFVKWGILVAFVVINIITIGLKAEHQKLIIDKIIWALGIFMVYLFINSLMSINITTSVFRTILFLLTLIVWFFVLPNYLNTKKAIFKLFNMLFYFFFIVLTLNIVLTILIPNLYFRIGIYIRYSGIADNANTLGMYSLASLIFILYKLRLGKKSEKIISWFMLLLVAINFSLTVSRSSMLGAAIILMIFTFYYYRKWFYTGILFGIVVILAFLFFPILLDVFRLATNPFSYRDQLFELAISKWLERMWIGQGYGTTIDITTQLFTFWQKGYHYLLIGKHFGNMYLELLCETGIVGIILFLPIIVILFKKQKILFVKAKGDLRVLLILYRGIFFGFLIQNIFESALLSPGNGVAFLFWTFSGLLISIERLIFLEKESLIS